MNDLEKGLDRKRMLSWGGLLKQKHKILNLDDAEDGNLINTSDEDKTTDEEEKAHSITAIWHFEKLIIAQFTCTKIILCVTGQCLNNSTLVWLKFLFLKIAYIYLAHICVLRAYICF